LDEKTLQVSQLTATLSETQSILNAKQLEVASLFSVHSFNTQLQASLSSQTDKKK
jgi:hypothetical protein